MTYDPVSTTQTNISLVLSLIFGLLCILLAAASMAMGICLLVLIVKALKKYIGSSEVRKERVQLYKSLGETLKAHRTKCKMTQEFVAEHLGISRQAVSKWESGTSDPSTSNLLVLAKLYGISAEDLLKQIQ